MSEPRIDPSSAPAAGSGVAAAGDDGRAGQLAEDNQVHYNAGENKFEIMLGGKPTTISPLYAVCYVLQNRYLTMSDAVAERTQEMQQQVNEINEANDWLNAIKNTDAQHPFRKPGDASSALQQWFDKNKIDVDALDDHPDSNVLQKLETDFSNHVDQLSSTNDLKMLKLKTVVNKAQEALTAADGVLQEIKQLMQTITNNMGR